MTDTGPVTAEQLDPDTAAHTSDHLLYVAEVFGPTFQGEGPSRGRRAGFVRLGGCNLHCTWCDTPYTWDSDRFDLRERINAVDVDDVIRQVVAMRVPLLVLTGGEPLLHQRRPAFRALLVAMARFGIAVEVETNGTIAPEMGLAGPPVYNVSPKLAHAGDPERARIVPAALTAFMELSLTGMARFKFVCRDRDDLEEVNLLVDEHLLPADKVWIMPEGTTAEAILAGARALADPVLEAGYNLSFRDHTLLWGDVPGR